MPQHYYQILTNILNISTNEEKSIFHSIVAACMHAASPVDHSFTAQFSEMEVGECKWQSWSAEDTGFKQTANK